MSGNTAMFDAMVDAAIASPRGLQGIRNLAIAEQVTRRIVSRLRGGQVIQRISLSHYPDSLMYLYLKDFVRHDEATLREVSKGFHDYTDRVGELRGCGGIARFANEYRIARVKHRLAARDYPRAWDEVRKALSGFRTEKRQPEEPPIAGDEIDFAADRETVKKLISDLHAQMLRTGLVQPIEKDVVEVRHFYTKGRYGLQKLAGGPFVLSFEGTYASDYGQTVDRIGQMVLAIKRWLSSERGRKRDARLAVKAAGLIEGARQE